jgi:hypothetical protein
MLSMKKSPAAKRGIFFVAGVSFNATAGSE